MIRKKLFLIFLAFFFCFSGMETAFSELKPGEILRRSDEARGNLDGVKWKLSIHSIEKEREQRRALDVKAKGYDFLAIMRSPAKVKGQMLLMVDHNMWFAKPGVKKPVPVSPRQKLLGGAAYGDIAATNYSGDYEATPLPDDVFEGELCYVFDLKAVTKKATYNQIKYWISKERLLGLKAEFFTVSGKMFKSATFQYQNTIKVNNRQQPFISIMNIVDAVISTNITTMEFSEPLLTRVPDSTFNLNFLMMRHS